MENYSYHSKFTGHNQDDRYTDIQNPLFKNPSIKLFFHFQHLTDSACMGWLNLCIFLFSLNNLTFLFFMLWVDILLWKISLTLSFERHF